MRADNNQKEIVEYLRARGDCTVAMLTQVGRGVPDILVGFREINLLIEIKPDGGKLRETQKAFHRDWKGREIVVIHSVTEMNDYLNLINKEAISLQWSPR